MNLAPHPTDVGLKILVCSIIILMLTCIALSLTPGILEIKLIYILVKFTTISSIMLLGGTNVIIFLFYFMLIKSIFIK